MCGQSPQVSAADLHLKVYTCRDYGQKPGRELMSESRREPVNAATAAKDVNTELRGTIDRRALLRAGALAAGAGLAGIGAGAAVLRAAQDAASQSNGTESIGEA